MKRVMTDEQKRHKAEYMRKYMRGYKPKPKTEGYGREPGMRADRFIDTESPLPSEDIILHHWSYWTILAEVRRLDKVIARCRAGNPLNLV